MRHRSGANKFVVVLFLIVLLSFLSACGQKVGSPSIGSLPVTGNLLLDNKIGYFDDDIF